MNLSEKNILKIWTKKNNFSVLPERWGIITSLILNSKEILFQEMLEETLFDLEKSVRWWIPIMFPFAWALRTNDAEKLWYFLPQHWVARINSWEVLEIWENFIKLKFDDKMQVSEYKIPQKFEIIAIYKLSENSLKIDFEIKNFDEKELKISHGFHPYFSVFDKNKIIWEKSLSEKIFENKNLWQNDWTLSLDLPENWFCFEIEDIWKICLKYSEEYKKFWIWSIKNKNFVCVEPVVWDEWNIVKNPIIVKSWKVFKSFFEIILE